MVTALDFNPRNADGSPASQAQLDQLNQAIRYLSQSPKAADLLQQAADKGVVIEFFSQMNGRYENGVISWNSEFSPKIKNSYTHETGYMSPALILLHEVVHSIDPVSKIDYIDINNPNDLRLYDQIPNDITNDKYKIGMFNNRERFATETEREIAKELGEPVRYLYSDVDVAFNPKSFQNEPVVNPNLSSVMDSARIFHQDGKLHEEISTGYNKAADGFVYSKELTVRDSQGRIERTLKTVFDENFQPVNAVEKTYDHLNNTIKVGTTHFNPGKPNGQCEYQESFTDLQGRPKFEYRSQSNLSHAAEHLSPKAEKFFEQCKGKLIEVCREKRITADDAQDFTNIAMALTAKAMANKMTRIEKMGIDTADNLKIYALSREPHVIVTSIEANEAVKIPAGQSMAEIRQIEQQFAQQEQQNQQQQQYNRGRSM